MGLQGDTKRVGIVSVGPEASVLDPLAVRAHHRGMKEGPDITRIAALIGDPTRASMLGVLMGGKALTSGELAKEAGVSPATASGHLAQLCAADLIWVRRQGRHRYYALSGSEVAEVLEVLSGLAAMRGHLRTRPGPKDPALRQARVCYDHLAGALAVRVFDSMAQRGFLTVDRDNIALSEPGAGFVESLGIDLSLLGARPRPLCRVCVDWSERRSHLGGAVGAALLQCFTSAGWITRCRDSRAVQFSPTGALALAARFPLPQIVTRTETRIPARACQTPRTP